MKYNHDKLIQAKRTIAMVKACTVSADHAIKAAQSIGGTVFDVKLKEFDAQVVWRVKLLRDTKRVKVYVHANTGQVLEAKAEVVVDSSHRIPAPLPTTSFTK